MVLVDCTKAQARLKEVSDEMETLAKTYLKGLMAKALKSHMASYNAPDAYTDYSDYYDENGNLNNQEEGLPEWSRTYLHIAKYTPYNIESGLDNLRKDLLDWSGANKINKKGFKIADGTNITLTDDEIANSALGGAITFLSLNAMFLEMLNMEEEAFSGSELIYLMIIPMETPQSEGCIPIRYKLQ